jgi:hypothetical protein
MHRKSSRITPCAASAIQGYSSSPNGLRIPRRPSIGPGLRAKPALTKKIAAPESQARGRHLLEGILPSGNNRIRQMPNPTAGAHIHSPTEPIAAANGTEPGLATRRPYIP